VREEYVRCQEEAARQARLAEEAERVRQARQAEEEERARQVRLAEEEAERRRVQEQVLERERARQARLEQEEAARRAREAQAEERARQARLAEEAERARQARLAEEEAERRRRVQEQVRLERERARQTRLEQEETARRAREAEAEAQFLQRERENAAKTIQHVILGSIVTLGAGLDVRNAITGFECCTFRIKGLPLDARRDEVAALFTQQGVDPARFQIVSMKAASQGMQEAVVITAADLAELLSLGLNGVEFRDRTIDFEVGAYNAPGGMDVSAPQDPNVLTISWRLPYESYVVEYSNYAEAQRKARELHHTMLNGCRMKAEMNTPPPGRVILSFNRNSIKITNLPLTVTRADVVRVSGSFNCRRLGGAMRWADVAEATRRLFAEVEQACPTPQSIVSSYRSPGAEIDGNAVLRVRFSSAADAQVVHAALSARTFPFLKFAPRMHLPTTTFNLTIPMEQHRAQRKLWDSLVTGIPDRKACSLVVQPECKVVRIRLSGSSKPAVGALKVRVEGLAAGEVVPGWHRSLGYSKSTFWKTVLKETGAYLRGDWKQQRLRVYGEAKAVEAAREMAKVELERLAAMEWSVSLMPRSVGFFVRQGIPTLRELLGEDSVKFHAPSRTITVTGGEDAQHQLERLINESLNSGRVAAAAVAHEQQCPICFDDISSPFRLGCGHRYCITCIRHLVLSALDSDDPQFPLGCMGDEGRCAVPIALPTLEQLLPANAFGRLLEVAFTTYIAKHPAELKYCATPDCTQIYRAADAGAAKGVQCPSCFTRVCTGCGDEPHDGVSCDEQRRTKNWDADDAWMAEQEVKRCPACSVLMQKTEGCNHMECK
jgi:actin-related protein